MDFLSNVQLNWKVLEASSSYPAETLTLTEMNNVFYEGKL